MDTPAVALSSLAETVRAIPVPFLVLDTECRVVAVSDAWETLTSRPMAQVIGKPGAHAFVRSSSTGLGSDRSQAIVGRIQDSWRRCLTTGQRETLTIQLDNLGSHFSHAGNCNVVNSPVVGADGRIESLVCCLNRNSPEQRTRKRPKPAIPAPTKTPTAAGPSTSHPELHILDRQLPMVRTISDLSRLVLEPALEALHAADIAVYLHERSASSLRLVSQKARGLGTAWRQPLVPMSKDLPIVEAATIGQPIVLDGTDAIASYSKEIGSYIKQNNSTGLLAVPIFHDDAMLGVLSASYAEPFQSATKVLSLASAVAVGLGPCLAQLIATEDQLMERRDVERRNAGGRLGLVGAAAQQPGLRVEVGIAGGICDAVTNQWVDTIPVTPDEYIGIMGHTELDDYSVGWSLGELKDVLRGIVYAGVTDPARALSCVDDAFPSLQLGGPAAATMVRLRRDGDTWQVTWSAAGTLWPIVNCAGNIPSQVEKPLQPMLGAPIARPRRNYELTLNPCDTLALLGTKGAVTTTHNLAIELQTHPPEPGTACPDLVRFADTLLDMAVAQTGYSVRPTVLGIQVLQPPRKPPQRLSSQPTATQ